MKYSHEYQLGFTGDIDALRFDAPYILGDMQKMEMLVAGAFDAFYEGRQENLLFLIGNFDTQQATLAVLQRGDLPAGLTPSSTSSRGEHGSTSGTLRRTTKGPRTNPVPHQMDGAAAIQTMIATIRRMQAKVAS